MGTSDDEVGLRSASEVQTSCDGAGGALVALRTLDDSTVEKPIGQLRSAQVVRAKPWRTFRNRHGQKHHSGYYWCATTSGHVLYESRLELARVMSADFNPEVVEIVAQPFRLRVTGCRPQTALRGRVREGDGHNAEPSTTRFRELCWMTGRSAADGLHSSSSPRSMLSGASRSAD